MFSRDDRSDYGNRDGNWNRQGGDNYQNDRYNNNNNNQMNYRGRGRNNRGRGKFRGGYNNNNNQQQQQGGYQKQRGGGMGSKSLQNYHAQHFKLI